MDTNTQRKEDFCIYMDHASTTPCDSRVVNAMLPYFSECFGNPSSRIHAFGIEAAEAVEVARQRTSELVGANPREIIFTSGATESNNLAILGLVKWLRRTGSTKPMHIVTSAIEHRSVLEPCRQLETLGFQVTFVGPNSRGEIGPAEISEAIRSDTVLVSLFWGNNETGSITSIPEVGRLCHDAGIIFHSDGSQIVGKLPIDVESASVDLLSWSAHKMYGPKGIGALFVRRKNPRIFLESLVFGGGQEQGLRAGTLNVPCIVGFGVASGLRRREMEEEAVRMAALRTRLEQGLAADAQAIKIHCRDHHRLPHFSNIGCYAVKGTLIEEIQGIACSRGSACSSGRADPSHVLLALGVPENVARNSVRLSLGRSTTTAEVDWAIEEICEAISRLM